MHRWADDLGGTLDAAWARMIDGAAKGGDRGTVSLATLGRDGPEVRTVVLRRADRGLAEVEIHSDAHAAKVRALEVDPRAAFVLWDAGMRFQIRVRMTVGVIVGDERRWSILSDEARWNYGAEPPPGTPIAAPGAWERPKRRDGFAALIGTVESLDTVLLDPAGHRRALFEAADEFAGRWLSP